jgi:hypothetical protein
MKSTLSPPAAGVVTRGREHSTRKAPSAAGARGGSCEASGRGRLSRLWRAPTVGSILRRACLTTSPGHRLPLARGCGTAPPLGLEVIMAAFRPVSAQVHFPDLEEEILARVTRSPPGRRACRTTGTSSPARSRTSCRATGRCAACAWSAASAGTPTACPSRWRWSASWASPAPASVRAFGVAEFNEACRANVLKYTAEWEKVVTRLGRWVDFENDYKTMDAAVHGERVVGLPRAVGQGPGLPGLPGDALLVAAVDLAVELRGQLRLPRRAGPRAHRAMPIVDGRRRLRWCGRPPPGRCPPTWRVAVGPEIDYVRARRADGHVYIVAEARLQDVLGKDATVLDA